MTLVENNYGTVKVTVVNECCGATTTPKLKTCFTYGNVRTDGTETFVSSNLGGQNLPTQPKYANPSGLNGEFGGPGPGIMISDFRHIIKGFYKRALGATSWGSNLITNSPILISPVGTVPDFEAFLKNHITC